MRNSKNHHACSLDHQIFKEIEYLLQSHNSENHKDIKLLIQWIEHFTGYFHSSYFTPVTMAHFFDVINAISIKHPQIKNDLERFFQQNQEIVVSILEKSYDLLLTSKMRELTHILSGVLLSKNFIVTKPWMDRWFECSQNHLNDANALDLKKITYCLLQAQIQPSQNWIQYWEMQCELYIFDFHQDPTSFYLALSFIDRWAFKNSNHLSSVLAQNTIMYLKEYAQSKEIFLISRCFLSEDINQNKEFLNEWFHLTEQLIRQHPKQYLEDICLAFLFIQKLQNEAPHPWIDLCIKTFITYFNDLTTKDIVKCLYSLALMQKKPEEILPFLKLSQKKIHMGFDESISEKNIYNIIQQLTISHFYFNKNGFDLGFETQKANLFLKKFQPNKNTNYTESTILKFLKQFKNLEVFSEYWIPEIADTVDFAIQTENGLKLVEYDGPCHEVNGTINRLTQLKTYLLQSYGYDLLRIHHRDTMNIGSILKENLNLKEDHPYVFYDNQK